jgi:hypothetical protein
MSNMKAELLIRERRVLEAGFIEVIVWRLPQPLSGSNHSLKYRLAYVVDGECVLRYDNEAGKGDHRHMGSEEVPYVPRVSFRRSAARRFLGRRCHMEGGLRWVQ